MELVLEDKLEEFVENLLCKWVEWEEILEEIRVWIMVERERDVL